MPTQNEYDVVKKQQRIESIKIQLLNFKYQVVDELQGNVVGQPTFNNNSDSDIRRTCNLTIIPTDSSFDITYGSKIWLDKYIKIYKGIKVHQYDDDYEWTNMGIYIVDNPTQTYNATTNTISIRGIDLMAKLTGLRNGNLEGMPYNIPQGSNIRNAMISLLELAGFTNYSIDDVKISVDSETTQLTPYEIKVDVGGTIYNLLSQLRDIVADYQMYFDVDGVFCFNRIPNGQDQQIMVDDDIWNDILIDYSRNISYSDIKNSVTVIGKMHDVSHFGNATVSYNNQQYICSCTIESYSGYLTSEDNGLIFGFTINQNIEVGDNDEVALKINTNDGRYLNLNGVKKLEENVYYVAKYVYIGGGTVYFDFLGQVQPIAIAKETNPSSPFYVNGTMGEVRIVLSGGDYDNIYSDSLALQRAKYELYLRCRLNDSVTISCVPIYWLDVNMAVSITLPNKQGIEETNKYLIKSINTSNNQSINLMRLYDEEPTKQEITIQVLTASDLNKIGIKQDDVSLTVSKTYETPKGIYHIESFEDGIFSNMTSLESITIDDDIEEIPNHMFYQCSSLSEVIISENSRLRRIGEYAFSDCNLYSNSVNDLLHNPKELEIIDNYAFYSGYRRFNGGYIDIDTRQMLSLISIGDYAFSRQNQEHGSAYLNVSIYKTDDWGEYTPSIQSIGAYAFSKANVKTISGFTEIDSISLGEYCFSYCPNLESIYSCPYSHENGINIVPKGLFYSCRSTRFKQYTRVLYIGSHITTIKEDAFNKMFNYSSISGGYIGVANEVQNIETNAFGSIHYIYNGSASGSPWGGTYGN